MFSVIRVMTCILWSVIGLALWIPLLIRTVVAFNLVTFFTIVTQDGKAVHRAHANVQFATTFYVAGFLSILNWTDNEEATGIPIKFDQKINSIAIFVLELLWTGIWWGTLLYSLA